jgi:hypothetical protein
MLPEAQFTEYVNRLKLSPAAEALIRQIRTSPPVRRVGTGTHNVAVYYASEKMGQTIQAESHTNEFHWVYHYEFSKDVMEYWCQPSVLELRQKIGAESWLTIIQPSARLQVIQRIGTNARSSFPENHLAVCGFVRGK